MPDPNKDSKKSRIITKMRIHEVSLAANPMNEFPYLTIKEGGKLMPTAVEKLVATLALKSEGFPEVVKEHLKPLAIEKLTLKDILEAMKELGFTENSFIPEGSVIIKKDEVVNRDTHDVVPKGTWEAKKEDKYANLSPEVKKEMEEQAKTIKELKMKNLMSDLAAVVGQEIAKELTPFWTNISEKEQNFILSTIKGLQKLVKDLGGAQGSQEEKDAIFTKAQMDKEVKEIAKNEKLSETDALILWAERNPEKQAKLAA